MKALIQAVVVSCALAAPALSFAQAQPGEVTRAQVREDLQRVEAAGYRPISRDATYPDDIQAAEAKVAASGQPMEHTAVGGVAPSGTMQMGSPRSTTDGNPQPVFFGN